MSMVCWKLPNMRSNKRAVAIVELQQFKLSIIGPTSSDYSNASQITNRDLGICESAAIRQPRSPEECHCLLIFTALSGRLCHIFVAYRDFRCFYQLHGLAYPGRRQ